jgi:hypothetical protein
MKTVRWIPFLLMLVLLALSVSVTAAAPAIPAPHAPRCEQLPIVEKGVLFYLSCTDKARDINEATILKSSVPLRYEAKWNGRSALIKVFRPVDDVLPIWFIWCVTDYFGNEVMGEFPSPDLTVR